MSRIIARIWQLNWIPIAAGSLDPAAAHSCQIIARCLLIRLFGPSIDPARSKPAIDRPNGSAMDPASQKPASMTRSGFRFRSQPANFHSGKVVGSRLPDQWIRSRPQKCRFIAGQSIRSGFDPAFDRRNNRRQARKPAIRFDPAAQILATSIARSDQ